MDSPQRGDLPKLAGEKTGRKRKAMSNFQARLITGLLSGLFTLGITYCGGLGFAFFCLCVGAAVLYEWNDITKIYASRLNTVCAWFFYILLGAVLLSKAGPAAVCSVLAGAIITISATVAFEQRRSQAALCRAGGFLYAALFPLSFALLRGGLAQGDKTGIYWTLFLYITVWASDVGAYICGRMFGGPKLAPRISPNKTWSGAAGGVIFAVLAASCFTFLIQQETILAEGAHIMTQFIPFSLLIAVAVLLSFVAQIGDLAESLFKRRFGVKDSGRLLPGHGGIMDRIDGLLPACIVFVCLLAATGWGFP